VSDVSKRDRLRLVEGEGERRRDARNLGGATTPRGTQVSVPERPLLSVVRPMPPRGPQQLALPGLIHDPATVLSLGIGSVDFETFADILRAHGVRRVIDTRLSPSFRHRGFSLHAVSRLFVTLGIEYQRMPELGNRFIGQATNEHVVLQRFAEPLAQNTDALRALHRKISMGPALLLGWSESHEMSERGVILDALARIESGFKLVVLPERSSSGATS